MPDVILRSPAIEKRLLEYVLSCMSQSDGWWEDALAGSGQSRRAQVEEYRARYAARRSVAGLGADAKSTPWPNASNIGIGAEQIFGEFLIPMLLANTHDLEPMLQAIDLQTGKVEDTLTAFHDHYHRVELSTKRALLEESLREVLTTGTVFHKWTYESIWKQQEVSLPVFVHPLSGQPMQVMDPQTGQPTFLPADPKMPTEQYPVDPATGIRLKLGKLGAVDWTHLREGPRLAVRPVESIGFPTNATQLDPQEWDYVTDRFAVSPWWFLGREGDPFDGKLQHLPLLWKWLGVSPDTVYRRPDGVLTTPIQLVEFHGKFPVTTSGKPTEVIALVAVEARLLLGWRVSTLPRRPYFNRQVYSRGRHPWGKGIPETCYGLRSALDASVNQDIDAGNIWNHPPVLLSELAMVEDEDYEFAGPGSVWSVRDINGAKVLAVPPATRNPIERETWLMSMLQRLWGVSDLNLSAPASSSSPQLGTATGVVSVLNQGTIKFGHLTRRVAETDTQEFQFVHDLFRLMLTNAKQLSVEGESMVIESHQREQVFRETFQIVARGNGLTTNPIVRQQLLLQAYPLISQNPLIAQDLEAFKDYTEQLLSAMGIQLALKDPQLLQQTKIFQELIQTPLGQQRVVPAMQQAIQELQAMAVSNGRGAPTTNGARGPHVDV